SRERAARLRATHGSFEVHDAKWIPQNGRYRVVNRVVVDPLDVSGSSGCDVTCGEGQQLKWLTRRFGVRGGGRPAEVTGIGDSPERSRLDIRPGERVIGDLGSVDRAVGQLRVRDRALL